MNLKIHDKLIIWFAIFFYYNSFQLTLANNEVNSDIYDIGVGIADITGQAADVGMMGYGKGGQDTQGIHTRLFARTFIVADSNRNRIVYVNCDIAMISTIVKLEVINGLKELYGDLYRHDNVMIASTHTHSAPGGFLQYVLYIISTQGFNKKNFQIIVSGILRSIYRAHSTMKKGFLLYNEGKLEGANINRSPTSYLANSQAERDLYEHNTDQTMQILKFVTINNEPIGVISWFAVHCTSMNNTNRLISGDNKGYASLIFEQQMNPGYMPGKGSFVAAFPNSNEGDVSPNTQGPRCIDTGLSCDIASSSCPDIKGLLNRQSSTKLQQTNEKCIASGPGKDMFESTQIIGQMQYAKAKMLFDTAKIRLNGPVKYIHKFIDMSQVQIYNDKGDIVGITCPAAMGFSFAAGTTDGPGAFDFTQGATSSTPFWNLVRDFIRRPSQQLIECQKPKPILLATGEMKFPYQWQPNIIPIQLISIGNFNTSPNLSGNKKSALVIAALPGEFTTMSGRRIRNRLHKILNEGFKPQESIQPSQPMPTEQQKPISNLEPSAASLMGNEPLILNHQMINHNNYLLNRQKRHLHLFRFLPLNRIHSFSDRMNTMSDSYLMQNQPIQINDQAPANEMQPAPINPPQTNEQLDESLNKTLEDANYAKESITELNSDGYLNANRVILSGLSNTYSSYITTFEEYQFQRYEAASTVYGAYTLQAYIQEFSNLAYRLIDPLLNLSRSSMDEDNVQPPNLLSKQFQIKLPVIYDGVKINAKFGDLIMDAKPAYKLGERVKVIFRSAHPQNWNSVEKTYLTVEYYNDKINKWQVVATDGSWETKFVWQRTGIVFGESQASIYWEIPLDTIPGIYRIRHFGASKNIFQTITPYSGSSSMFKVQSIDG